MANNPTRDKQHEERGDVRERKMKELDTENLKTQKVLKNIR